MSVASIVLAAGRGTRFGTEAKMLAPFEGEPLVRRAALAAIGSGALPVLVVVGHRQPEVAAALDGLPVTVVPNPDYADGLSTSLRAGFAALPDSAEAAVVQLGDMPGVDAQLVGRLIRAWLDADRPVALVPEHDGRRGNPAVLSAALAPEIARLRGDEGAGRMLRGRTGVVAYPVDDPGILLDVDTPAALAQARTTPCRMAE